MKKIFYIIALSHLLIFGLQGLFIKFKLNTIGASHIKLVEQNRQCENNLCRATYLFQNTNSAHYLLIGHIIRSFSLKNDEDNSSLNPISFSRSNIKENWTSLVVFDISNIKKVRIETEWPENALINNIAGVYPRVSNNEEILTVPSIGPILTIFSYTLFILIFIFFGFLLQLGKQETILDAAFYKSKFFFWSMSLTLLIDYICLSQYFDSLFPSAYFRNVVMMFFALNGLTTLTLATTEFKKIKFLLPLVYILQLLVALNSRVSIGPIALYPLTLDFGIATLFLTFLITKRWLFLVPALFLFCDFFRIIGFPIPDYPPIYWNFSSIGTIFLFFIWDAGAKNIFPHILEILKNAQKDVLYNEFENHLKSLKLVNGQYLAGEIEKLLKLLSKILESNSVSIVVILNDQRPVTYIYRKENNIFKVFDDGKIVGKVLARTIHYKDNFMFSSIQEVMNKKIMVLEEKADYNYSKYFCCIPLVAGNVVLGAFSCTSFNEKELEVEAIKWSKKQNIQKISNLLVQFLHQSITLEKDNLDDKGSKLVEFVNQTNREENIKNYIYNKTKMIASELDLTVALFELGDGEDAYPVFIHSPNPEIVKAWLERPLKIVKHTTNRIGPFIVAFTEEKSSFIRDIDEIANMLHPHSVKLFEFSQTSSLITIPLFTIEKRRILVFMGTKPRNLNILFLNELEKIVLFLKKNIEEKLVVLVREQEANVVTSSSLQGLSVIASGIAHEVRNAIQPAKGSLRKLELFIEKGESAVTKEIAQKALNLINSGINRTIRIVDNISFSSGLNESEYGDIKVLQALNVVVDMIRATNVLLEKNIDFQFLCSDEEIIFGNRIEMNQVFFNLIKNAVDAIDKLGTVTVSISEKSSMQVLRFKDSGNGISEDSLKKVFQPFYTTKKVGSGSGLGLFMVLEIVKKHNGEIFIQSKVGEGTEVQISLPHKIS